MVWLLIIVMVQWSFTVKTCLNITDTTDVENAVLQLINLGGRVHQILRHFLRCGQLDRDLCETHLRGQLCV